MTRIAPDRTRRIVKIGDALSQLLNVAFLPRHEETTANESVSGRAHRCGWRRVEVAIDGLFAWLEARHCRAAYEKDVVRSRALIDAADIHKEEASRVR